MIELFANNIKLPFGDSLVLKFFNPMFNDIGSFSFPVSFPSKLPFVQKAFGFPGNLESEVTPTITGKIKTDSFEINGYWKVTKSGKNIEAYFQGGTGGFYQSIAGKYLTDLAYNGVTRPAGFAATREEILTYMTSTMEAAYPAFDYTAYCAYMPNALGENTDADVQFVNPVAGTGAIAFILPASGKINSTVYLFVGAVLDYIFAEFGYKVEKNIFKEDPELKYLTVFNTYNQNAYWEFDYRNFVPRRTITEFIKKLRKFNILIDINENTRSVTIDTFDNVVSRVENSDLKLIGKEVDPVRKTGIKLVSELTDAWTQSSYLTTGEFPGDSSTIYEVDSFRDITPGTGNVGYIYYIRNEENYFVIRDMGGSVYEAQRICSDQLPFYAGTNYSDEEVGAGSPGMCNLRQSLTYEYSGTQTTFRDWLIPRCDLECNFRASGFSWLTRDPHDFKDFPIMLLFSRGKVWNYTPEEEGSPFALGLYPLGSTGVYDSDGDKISAAYISLAMNGTYGIANTLWKNRIYWELYQKKNITADIYGSDIIKLFNFLKAINIENSNYLVNSFELELTNKQRRVRNADLFRL